MSCSNCFVPSYLTSMPVASSKTLTIVSYLAWSSSTNGPKAVTVVPLYLPARASASSLGPLAAAADPDGCAPVLPPAEGDAPLEQAASRIVPAKIMDAPRHQCCLMVRFLHLLDVPPIGCREGMVAP